MKVTSFEEWRQRGRITVGDSYVTPREYQCIRMYISGRRQSDMLAELRCSKKTVNNHLRSAKLRLGANTLHQLIAMVAVSDALRGRDRSSNREPLTVNAPGAAPSRGL